MFPFLSTYLLYFIVITVSLGLKDTKWVLYKLPKSFIDVKVLETTNMDVSIENAIETQSIEPYGLVTW